MKDSSGMKHTSQDNYRSCGCRSAGECQHNNFLELNALDAMVDEFSEAMKARLKKCFIAGRTGWDDPNWTIREIQERLMTAAGLFNTGREQVPQDPSSGKYDPVDMANFAAFWWNRLLRTGPELRAAHLSDAPAKREIVIDDLDSEEVPTDADMRKQTFRTFAALERFCTTQTPVPTADPPIEREDLDTITRILTDHIQRVGADQQNLSEDFASFVHSYEDVQSGKQSERLAKALCLVLATIYRRNCITREDVQKIFTVLGFRICPECKGSDRITVNKGDSEPCPSNRCQGGLVRQ